MPSAFDNATTSPVGIILVLVCWALLRDLLFHAVARRTFLPVVNKNWGVNTACTSTSNKIRRNAMATVAAAFAAAERDRYRERVRL
ncbi:hypothetical protein BU25DRAFT_461271 [Macroventuria anomochaeta]|uniref:Uncharacterized protein n=1 Tax=Macroventuria anomochaeta TaxID=301207 RepID=A0ACB6RR98_9PLEO|nr:uncharacterized protein BU25DRAFT_461271 [Macroventuria anomochaeta]KAF2624421.1 hypothetical protein BU25DRAFT_461271 [Macroventuria anomochaeta]